MVEQGREEVVTLRYKDGLRAYDVKKPFEGVLPNLERRHRETDNPWVREDLSLWYGGERVWIEAVPVDAEGVPWASAGQVLIRCDAIPEGAEETRGRGTARRPDTGSGDSRASGPRTLR